MSLKIKTLVNVLFILGFLYMPISSYAILEISLQDSDINIETVPQNPEPYKNVLIKISSYATDLNKAMIEWKSGTNTVLSGYGKTSYSFTTLGPNTTTVFNVTITPENSTEGVTKIVAITSTNIDILWESVDGYTPPFYKGKSFPSREGTIRVVAIPDTSSLGSTKQNNISYTWKNSNKTTQNNSGYNKNSYVFKNDVLNQEENITVSASSIGGSYNATKNIKIPMISPEIIFYKKSPTEGTLYNQALSNQTVVTEDEITIVVEPYFLSTKDNENNFSYSWKINGEDIATPSKKKELTIRPTSRGGYATINIVMENLNTLFQKVSGQLKLNF